MARDDYRQAFARVRASGGRVIGYVHSSYTRRALAEVQADVERWASFYPIDGIFVDEMANDTAAATLAYYRELSASAKQQHPRWIIVGNPGTRIPEVYLTTGAADVLVTFENGSGYANLTPDPWTRRHPATAFAHLGYALENDTHMGEFADLARTRGAAWIYATDDTLPNPWDRLPTYWEQAVERIRDSNRGEPVRVTATDASPGNLRLVAESAPGLYVVETSTDLQRWTPWTSAGAPDGRLELLIPMTNSANRFLRVRR